MTPSFGCRIVIIICSSSSTTSTASAMYGCSVASSSTSLLNEKTLLHGILSTSVEHGLGVGAQEVVIICEAHDGDRRELRDHLLDDCGDRNDEKEGAEIGTSTATELPEAEDVHGRLLAPVPAERALGAARGGVRSWPPAEESSAVRDSPFVLNLRLTRTSTAGGFFDYGVGGGSSVV